MTTMLKSGGTARLLVSAAAAVGLSASLLAMGAAPAQASTECSPWADLTSTAAELTSIRGVALAEVGSSAPVEIVNTGSSDLRDQLCARRLELAPGSVGAAANMSVVENPWLTNNPVVLQHVIASNTSSLDIASWGAYFMEGNSAFVARSTPAGDAEPITAWPPAGAELPGNDGWAVANEDLLPATCDAWGTTLVVAAPSGKTVSIEAHDASGASIVDDACVAGDGSWAITTALVPGQTYTWTYTVDGGQPSTREFRIELPWVSPDASLRATAITGSSRSRLSAAVSTSDWANQPADCDVQSRTSATGWESVLDVPATGELAALVPAGRYYRISCPSDPVAHVSAFTSAPVFAPVRYASTLSAKRAVKHGRSTTVTGRVSPAAGVKVVVQVKPPRKAWRTVAVTTTSSSGSYAARIKVGGRGWWKVRTLVKPGSSTLVQTRSIKVW